MLYGTQSSSMIDTCTKICKKNKFSISKCSIATNKLLLYVDCNAPNASVPVTKIGVSKRNILYLTAPQFIKNEITHSAHLHTVVSTGKKGWTLLENQSAIDQPSSDS